MDCQSHSSVTSYVICLFCSNFPPRLYETEITIAAETSDYILKSNIHVISVENELLRSIKLHQQIPRHFVLNLQGGSHKQYGPPTQADEY